ncbi:single-stranded DNA-binding protein [Candidatus Hodarchaeum mangrovi]
MNEFEESQEVGKKEESEEEITQLTISELTPFARRIQVKFVVLDKGEPRTILSKKTNEEHVLADVKIGDETGIITCSLWDETIDRVSEGETYIAKSCYVNVFQNHMRLALGKWGTLENANESIALENVNMDNDLSEQEHKISRRRKFRRHPRKNTESREDDY